MFPSCQHSIAQTEKTSWTKTEIKENAWPLDSASSEYGPGRFDCLSRWYKFSPQQDCIARRTAARHQAPSMTPSWTLLGAQGNCFHQISLFGGHIIKVCWPVLAKIETACTLCRGLRDWGGKHCNLHDFYMMICSVLDVFFDGLWCFMMCILSSYIKYEHSWTFMRAFGERTSVWGPLVKGPHFGGLWKCSIYIYIVSTVYVKYTYL